MQVPVRRDHPLAREWAIVMHAPGASACLAAWEIPAPGEPADADRRFEVLWSPEPEVALDALAVAAELIAPLAPDVAGALEVEPAEPRRAAELRRASRGRQAGSSDARLHRHGLIQIRCPLRIMSVTCRH